MLSNGLQGIRLSRAGLFAAAHTALQMFPQAELDAEFERIWKLHSARIAKKTAAAMQSR